MRGHMGRGTRQEPPGPQTGENFPDPSAQVGCCRRASHKSAQVTQQQATGPPGPGERVAHVEASEVGQVAWDGGLALSEQMEGFPEKGLGHLPPRNHHYLRADIFQANRGEQHVQNTQQKGEM